MEPELSMRIATTVSRNFVSCSCLVETCEAWIDDDPVETRRINEALLEIERPVSRLSREQPALQPQDQATKVATEFRATLIEEEAFPAQLRVARQIGSLDHEIVRRRVDGIRRRLRRRVAAEEMQGFLGLEVDGVRGPKNRSAGVLLEALRARLV
jgi:hypothetical protein